jgi:ElaB/YqjD/DUF883 family membrane-anchored ribosome-binding protein
MARDPGQIEQEIKGLRQEITGRVDNLKERVGTDRQDAIDEVKSLVSKTGVEDGMQERPYVYLGGALAAGVVAGLASGMVRVPMPSFGGGVTSDGERQAKQQNGILASLIASAEAVAFTEGKDAVKSWLRSRNGHETGPEPVPEADNSELGTSIPPPSPVS